MFLYKTFGSQKGLAKFLDNLFTTPDPMWQQYMADALKHVQMNFELPPNFTDEQIAKVVCPWLCVTADQDISVPGPALAQRIRTSSPGATIISIPNCKHSPPFTQEFREALAGWVKENADSAQAPAQNTET